MVEQRSPSLASSHAAKQNSTSHKEELLGELTLLRVRLEHATEENEVLQKKVRLSDEIASQSVKRYAEFTANQYEVAVRHATLHEK